MSRSASQLERTFEVVRRMGRRTIFNEVLDRYQLPAFAARLHDRSAHFIGRSVDGQFQRCEFPSRGSLGHWCLSRRSAERFLAERDGDEDR